MADQEEKTKKREDKTTLELCFTLFIGLLVAAAFVRALTYDLVSARTPLVILVPLLILTGIQVKRTWNKADLGKVKNGLAGVFRLKNREFNSIAGFFGWMIFLIVLIFITGHYIGMAAFMFFLMYLVAEEKLTLSVIVSAAVTLVIFLLFEYLFNIELYRGLIYRIWMGYGM